MRARVAVDGWAASCPELACVRCSDLPVGASRGHRVMQAEISGRRARVWQPSLYFEAQFELFGQADGVLAAEVTRRGSEDWIFDGRPALCRESA